MDNSKTRLGLQAVGIALVGSVLAFLQSGLYFEAIIAAVVGLGALAFKYLVVDK